LLKFAKEHTNPIRRSAFTYCEDELPSRLDLGKEKYGGPFSNEEVENVKAFVGILCVLLTTGPTFIADIAVHAILPSIAESLNFDRYSGNRTYGTYSHNIITTFTINFYSSGSLTPLVIVVLIPLYLFLLRPFIHDCIPGMLKRMGIGMVMFFLSGLCTFLMSTFIRDCTTEYESDDTNLSCPVFGFLKVNTMHFLIIQSSLNAVGFMLFNIATFEFICAQSPHSMKGLLIGTFFAIKGVFELIGVIAVQTPVAIWCKPVAYDKFPICGFVYYLLNIVILLIGIIAFTIVARRYQYRQRDEPDNIFRYTEEYYANARDEPNYDYDDYDNLDVETVMK
jgi:peptide/histidine transporter 3/4